MASFTCRLGRVTKRVRLERIVRRQLARMVHSPTRTNRSPTPEPNTTTPCADLAATTGRPVKLRVAGPRAAESGERCRSWGCAAAPDAYGHGVGAEPAAPGGDAQRSDPSGCYGLYEEHPAAHDGACPVTPNA